MRTRDIVQIDFRVEIEPHVFASSLRYLKTTLFYGVKLGLDVWWE